MGPRHMIIIMKPTISLELGPTYEITYDDGTVRTFIVQGGPDVQVFFKDSRECEGLFSATKHFKKIEKIDENENN